MKSDAKEKKRKLVPVVFYIDEESYDQIEGEIEKIEKEHFHCITKTQWIIQALKERLEKDEDTDFPEEKPKEKVFTIRIPESFLERIQSQVKRIQNTKRSRYTRGEWVQEAIKEKLIEIAKTPN